MPAYLPLRPQAGGLNAIARPPGPPQHPVNPSMGATMPPSGASMPPALAPVRPQSMTGATPLSAGFQASLLTTGATLAPQSSGGGGAPPPSASAGAALDTMSQPLSSGAGAALGAMSQPPSASAGAALGAMSHPPAALPGTTTSRVVHLLGLPAGRCQGFIGYSRIKYQRNTALIEEGAKIHVVMSNKKWKGVKLLLAHCQDVSKTWLLKAALPDAGGQAGQPGGDHSQAGANQSQAGTASAPPSLATAQAGSSTMPAGTVSVAANNHESGEALPPGPPHQAAEESASALEQTETRPVPRKQPRKRKNPSGSG